jgi:hypothetical protein
MDEVAADRETKELQLVLRHFFDPSARGPSRQSAAIHATLADRVREPKRDRIVAAREGGLGAAGVHAAGARSRNPFLQAIHVERPMGVAGPRRTGTRS